MLTAAVIIPIVLGIVFYGSPEWFLALVILAVGAGMYEYFSLVAKMGVDGFPALGGVLGALLLFCFYFGGVYFLEWGVLVFVSLFLAWILFEKNVKVAIDQISYTLLGIGYVAGLSGYFLLIRQMENGRFWLLFLFLIIWMGDAGAYYGGRKWGRRPLAPSVSPKKTLEGTLFGLLGSLLGGLFAHFVFLQSFSLFHCLLAAGICGMIGQIGDLAESLLKRNAGVKDSSGLIPGHGGVLDRIDSLLFAGPVFYIYHKLFL